MTLWTSSTVSMGSDAYQQAKQTAHNLAQLAKNAGTAPTARVIWQDEYNDFSVRGVFTVSSR